MFEGIAEHISLSSDGRTLYYATNAGDIDRRHLWRANTSGGEAEQLTFGEGRHSVELHIDGAMVVRLEFTISESTPVPEFSL